MPNVSNAQLQQQLENLATRLEEGLKGIESTTVTTKTEIAEKINEVNHRLDKYDEKFDRLERNIQNNENRIGEIAAQVENGDLITNQKLISLTQRLETMEEKLAKIDDISSKVDDISTKVEPLEVIPNRVNQLAELVEDRTNRQLRETLVFKNVPEEEGEQSYDDTKELLARLINEHCNEFSYDYALSQIKRAHRERKRTFEDNQYSRAGKRLIFAAFHSWDMCQKLIETFRQKCIASPTFKIAVDQKYGPLTSKRRHLAFEKRKQLKEQGVISGGYVDFPAKLMVNMPGDYDADNKKVYKLLTNFSRHPVD